MRFAVDNAPLDQILLQIIRVSAVNIIAPMLHYSLHLLVALPRKNNGRSLGSFPEAMIFRKSEKIGYKITFTFFLV